MHVVLDFNPALRERFSGYRTYGAGLLQGLVGHREIEKITLLINRQSVPLAAELPLCAHSKVRLAAPPLRLRKLEQWWNLAPWPPLQRWCGPFDPNIQTQTARAIHS